MMTTEVTHEPNAAGSSPHVIIRASAGTGKTHRLSSRFLKLLFDGHAVDRILATTFTRKAAGEILERVIKRLADSTVNEHDRTLLGSEVGDPELSIERCRTPLAELTRALNRIRVSTLDSFFGNLARTFGLELGLPPGWEILDQHDDFRLRRVALERMLAENQSNEISELLHLLNKGEAKRSINRMLLDTISDAYELYQETLPDGGTAWHTIPQMPMLNETQMAPLISDLRSLSIGNSRVRDAHEKAIERVENEDWDNYLKTGLAPKILNDEDKYSSWKITPEVRAAYQAVTRQAVAVKLDQLTKQTEGAYRLARSFDEKYDQLKLDNEAILFNDVPVKLRQVGGNTGNRRIAYRMGSSTDHLLLDEFQDTSGTQWNAIAPFAKTITESVDSTKSFFCVGDTKQAIYGWRGGQAIILDSLSEQLENVSIESLNLSRRSSPEVIDTVNQIFSKMHRHDGLDQYEAPIRSWCDAFPTHETAKEDMPGYACMYVADEAA
ncbi:MAG: UvrD-helicase domain-containing protein, partial [Planctomycetota bacterium]